MKLRFSVPAPAASHGVFLFNFKIKRGTTVVADIETNQPFHEIIDPPNGVYDVQCRMKNVAGWGDFNAQTFSPPLPPQPGPNTIEVVPA